MIIGVLALQGAFMEHIHMLRKLGAECREVRQLSDWTNDLNGLIIPGGESTVMSKLLHDLGLVALIRTSISAGLPVFGTCAGLILLAKDIIGGSTSGLKCMDIRVHRNAYGRQLGSFETRGTFAGRDDIPMVFIRAPYIESVGKDVEILSTVNGRIVAACQNNMLATAFHPELTDDGTVHICFLHIAETAGFNNRMRPGNSCHDMTGADTRHMTLNM